MHFKIDGKMTPDDLRTDAVRTVRAQRLVRQPVSGAMALSVSLSTHKHSD
jgi:hypothetical protein